MPWQEDRPCTTFTGKSSPSSTTTAFSSASGSSGKSSWDRPSPTTGRRRSTSRRSCAPMVSATSGDRIPGGRQEHLPRRSCADRPACHQGAAHPAHEADTPRSGRLQPRPGHRRLRAPSVPPGQGLDGHASGGHRVPHLHRGTDAGRRGCARGDDSAGMGYRAARRRDLHAARQGRPRLHRGLSQGALEHTGLHPVGHRRDRGTQLECQRVRPRLHRLRSPRVPAASCGRRRSTGWSCARSSATATAPPRPSRA